VGWKGCCLRYELRFDGRPSEPRKGEPRHIRSRDKGYPKLGAMLLLAIVDRQSFPELRGGSSYDVIEIGVIGRLSLEDFDADRTFFKLIG
jgi:hypothetical protein